MGVLENSYVEFQTGCEESSSVFEVEHYIGKVVDIFECPQRILFFKAGEDLTISAFNAGNITGSLTDSTDSATAYTQKTVDAVEWPIGYSVVPSLGSKFWQALLEIQTENTAGGFQGDLFKAYMQSGFKIKRVLKNKLTGETIEQVFLDLVLDNIPDALGFDFNATDNSTDMTFYVQRDPIQFIEMAVGESFGLPNAITAPTIDLTVTTATSIKATGTLTDTDGVSHDDTLFYKFVPNDVASQVVEASGASGTEVDLGTVEEGYVLAGYRLSENNVVYTKKEFVTTVRIAASKEAAKEKIKDK